MTQRRYHRSRRDLLEIIAELQVRVDKLETTRRLGSAAVESGELVLNGGDLVVKNDAGEVVLRILHGNTPEVRMTPTGGPTDYRATSFSWEHEALGTIWQAGIQKPDGSQDGGKLLLMQTGSYLSFQPASGDEVYLGLGTISGNDDSVYLRGRFVNGYINDGKEALVAGSVSIGAGVSSYSHTYSPTFATAPVVVYGLLNSAGAVTHSLTASSTSGFTVAWSGTLAKTLFWAAFRV